MLPGISATGKREVLGASGVRVRLVPGCPWVSGAADESFTFAGACNRADLAPWTGLNRHYRVPAALTVVYEMAPIWRQHVSLSAGATKDGRPMKHEPPS